VTSASRQSPLLKRTIDLCIALPVSIATLPLCAILVILATLDTREFGLFMQIRVGRDGKPFTVYKIRSMRSTTRMNTVTVEGDARVTPFGALLRRFKVDELPQFWNVVRGDMSLVGPRPDVPGYADRLEGPDRSILAMRPGITGPATLLFRREEAFLARQPNPFEANDLLVWPAKVRVNLAYLQHASLGNDLALLDMTLRGTDSRLWSMLASWSDGELVDDPVVSEMLKSFELEAIA